jgi:hypothetical protein
MDGGSIELFKLCVCTKHVITETSILMDVFTTCVIQGSIQENSFNRNTPHDAWRKYQVGKAYACAPKDVMGVLVA